MKKIIVKIYGLCFIISILITQIYPLYMIVIPSGTYTQRCMPSSQVVQKEFTHTIDSFLISKYELKGQEWNDIFDESGYQVKKKMMAETLVIAIQSQWAQVILWCNAASVVSRLEPCYYTLDGKPITTLTTDVVWL